MLSFIKQRSAKPEIDRDGTSAHRNGESVFWEGPSNVSAASLPNIARLTVALAAPDSGPADDRVAK
jgi:hypothetical protein